MKPLALAASACAAALLLCGCSALGGISGGVAGLASGAATANPGVGIAVGIGVKAAVDATVKTVLRDWSDEEQTRIATAIGSTAVGQRGAWDVVHSLPYKNAHGDFTVLRAFETALANCKEALFTVADGNTTATRPAFVTTVCRGDAGWRWALAEPAVERWGALQ